MGHYCVVNKQQLNYECGLPEYDTIWFGKYSSELRSADVNNGGK
jgi:hypothetical protein